LSYTGLCAAYRFGMGGDEFVVVFRNVKSYDEVTLGAGRIIETLNHPIIIDHHPLQTMRSRSTAASCGIW
jgi:GGDEF domain-containing protein